MTLEEAKEIWQACLEHAEDLLVAADNLLSKQPYLAYHISTLALEEVGKAIQVGLAALPPRDTKPPFSDIDDHVQKLFWALWSVLLKPMIELSGPQHGFRGAPCQVFSC